MLSYTPIGKNYHFTQREVPKSRESSIPSIPMNNNLNHDHKSNFGTNNISSNFLMKNNSRFVSNVNPASRINQQERVITFGQDSNENSFKKILRKPTISNLIQNTSYNIITGAPYVVGTNKNKKNEKLDDLFFSYKNSSLTGDLLNNNPYSSNTQNAKDGITTTPYTSSNITPNVMTNNINPTTNLANTISYRSNNEFNLKKDPKDSLKMNAFQNDYSGTVNTSASAVKEYAMKADQNVRSRNTMEDTMKAIDRFNANSDSAFFGVFDGHGGVDVANYVKERLPAVLEKGLNSRDKAKDIEGVITAAFHKVDEEVKFHDSDNVGCTGTMVYIAKESDSSSFNQNRKVLYVANVGDSRCVLISSFGAKRLSYDHKVSDPNESARIINSGGVIFRGRVFGSLILSRAFGDYALKSHGVIATPFVTKHYISERDRYIVIASDGLWDVLTDDEVSRMHLTVSNSDDFSKLLIKTALSKGTEDNISCIVIKLF